MKSSTKSFVIFWLLLHRICAHWRVTNNKLSIKRPQIHLMDSDPWKTNRILGLEPSPLPCTLTRITVNGPVDSGGSGVTWVGSEHLKIRKGRHFPTITKRIISWTHMLPKISVFATNSINISLSLWFCLLIYWKYWRYDHLKNTIKNKVDQKCKNFHRLCIRSN
mgnify:CR=1 FL=1